MDRDSSVAQSARWAIYLSVLSVALACGKTEEDPDESSQGGSNAGGTWFGGSGYGGQSLGGRAAGGSSGDTFGGRSAGGSAAGGRATGGAASGGSVSGGADVGGQPSGGTDMGGAGGEAGVPVGGHSMGGNDTGGNDAGGVGGEVVQPIYRGSIRISNAAERVPTSFTAQPSFALRGQSTQCRQVTYGDCVVSDRCQMSAAIPSYASAGSVRIAIPARSIEVSAQPTGMTGSPSPLYVQVTSNAPFKGGDLLQVSVSGNTVPAFSSSFIVPAALSVHAPVPDSAGVIRAPRSQDLSLDVQVTAQAASLEIQGASSLPGPAVNLACSAKAWGNPLVIPAAALDALGYPLRLSIRTLHPASLVVGEWQVEAPVTFEVVDQNQAVIDAIAID